VANFKNISWPASHKRLEPPHAEEKLSFGNFEIDKFPQLAPSWDPLLQYKCALKVTISPHKLISKLSVASKKNMIYFEKKPQTAGVLFIYK